MALIGSLAATRADAGTPPCGEPRLGSCFAFHPSPGCDNASCCATACGFDPFCCDVAWDQACVDLAFGFCTPCSVCGPFGSAVPENEPCGTNVLNPGCDDPSHAAFGIDCGISVCGKLWAQFGQADSDWYIVFVTDPDGDGVTNLCLSFNAGAPMQAQVFDLTCPTLPPLMELADDCLGVRNCVCVPAPGSYYVKVSFLPDSNGNPIIAGYECAGPLVPEYVLLFDCFEPCDGAPLGPCCYTVPPGLDLCAYTTVADCGLTYNGTWLGPGSTCSPDPCKPPCAPPPSGMVGWWPLDETTGTIAADITLFGASGTLKPSGSEPAHVAGFVDDALLFDGTNDNVEVPHAAQHDFGQGPFSIDAWVRWTGAHGGGVVQKYGAYTGMTCTAPFAGFGGYGLEIDASGFPFLCLETPCARCFPTATTAVAVGGWTHVAVTVSGCQCTTDCFSASPQRLVTFYVNGALAGASTASDCCDLSNHGPLWIGRNEQPQFFPGHIDEVELFNRVLSVAEIQSIHNANCSGKCKEGCGGEWDVPLCQDDASAVAKITICNNDAVAHCYEPFFQPKPASAYPGDPHVVDGPTVFTVLDPVPVCVPAHGWKTFNVQIDRPSGMVALKQVGVYKIIIKNLDSGAIVTCEGSVEDRRDLCTGVVVSGFCCPAETAVFGPGNTITTSWTFQNTSGEPIVDRLFQITAFGPDMLPSQFISVAGQPPAKPYLRIGGTGQDGVIKLDVPVTLIAYDGGGISNIVAFDDDDGDGQFDPLASISVITVPSGTTPAACYYADHDCTTVGGLGCSDLACCEAVCAVDASCCMAGWDQLCVNQAMATCVRPCVIPGDFDGDCTVNGADLGVLLGNWGGSGVGDLDGNGVVDGADLGILLGNWGVGAP